MDSLVFSVFSFSSVIIFSVFIYPHSYSSALASSLSCCLLRLPTHTFISSSLPLPPLLPPLIFLPLESLFSLTYPYFVPSVFPLLTLPHVFFLRPLSLLRPPLGLYSSSSPFSSLGFHSANMPSHSISCITLALLCLPSLFPSPLLFSLPHHIPLLSVHPSLPYTSPHLSAPLPSALSLLPSPAYPSP